MNPRNSLILEYGTMAEGTSLSGQTCPKCNGGRSGERSLSISLTDGTLKWLCHRASCGFAGGHQMSAGTLVAPPTPSPGRRRSVTFERHPVPQEVVEWLGAEYLISPETINKFGLEWTDSLSQSGKGRVVIPIRSRDFSVRGHVLRAIDKGDLPKGLNAWDGTGAGAWFNKVGSNKLIIVEDCYSAIRASEYINSFALLGTHMSADTIEELRESGLRDIYLALDKDATNISISHVSTYKNKLPMKVVALKKDIKNMSPEQLEELVNGLK